MIEIALSDKIKNYLFYGLTAVVTSLVIAHGIFWSGMPIYFDEMGSRFFITRAIFDDWHRVSPLGMCTDMRVTEIPYALYPAAFILSAYTFLQDMQLHRYISLLMYFIMLLFIGLAVARHLNRENYRPLGALMLMGLSAMFLGILPSTYLMLRPEHMLLILMAFSCWVLGFRPGKASLLLSTVLLVLFSVAVYYHPKAMYFVPAMAAVLLTLNYGRPIAAMTAIAVLGVFSYYGLKLNAAQLLHCPEDPAIEAMLRGFNIDATGIFTSPIATLKSIYEHNADRGLSGLFKKIIFKTHYDGGGSNGYLPLIDMTRFGIKTSNVFIMIS